MAPGLQKLMIQLGENENEVKKQVQSKKNVSNRKSRSSTEGSPLLARQRGQKSERDKGPGQLCGDGMWPGLEDGQGFDELKVGR